MNTQPESTHDDVIERYLLELMDTGERAAFETRLASEPSLAKEVHEMREALASWGLSEPVAVPAGMKDRVMANLPARSIPASRITPITQAPSRRTVLVPVLWTALAASLALTVKFAADLRNAREANDSALSTVAFQAGKIAHQDSLIASFIDGGVELVSLAATGRGQPGVKTWLDRTRRRAMITVARMDAPEAGKEYQLWFIVAGAAPIPSVTFTPDANGQAFVGEISLPENVATAGEITTAITVEPPGGSAAPTSSPIFVGKSVAPKQ